MATFILYLKAPTKGGATAFPLKAKKKAAAHNSGQSTPIMRSLLARTMPGQHGGDLQVDESLIEESSAPGGGPVKQDLQSSYCEEDSDVLKVFPQSGDAVLFYDYVPMDTPGYEGEKEDSLHTQEVNRALADPTSAHAGCPPLEGTKIIATRWMRSAQFL